MGWTRQTVRLCDRDPKHAWGTAGIFAGMVADRFRRLSRADRRRPVLCLGLAAWRCATPLTFLR
jgi:hypothetical protein